MCRPRPGEAGVALNEGGEEVDTVALARVAPEPGDVRTEAGVDRSVTGGVKSSQAGKEARHEPPRRGNAGGCSALQVIDGRVIHLSHSEMSRRVT